MDLLRSTTHVMQELVEVIWIASLACGLIGASVLASVTVSEKGRESFPSSRQVLASIVEPVTDPTVMEVFCKWRVAILLYPMKITRGWSHQQLARKSPILWIVFLAIGAWRVSAQLIVMAGTASGRG